MGLYYLQSRYYNPTMGRFLNADALVSTGQGVLGNNMFAYCLNNPTKYSDPFGNTPVEKSTTYCYFSGGIGNDSPFAKYCELMEKFKNAGVELYFSKESALNAWINVYLPLSEEYEYVTFLYSIQTYMGTQYFTTTTFRGSKGNFIMSANVIAGTIALWLQDSISAATLVAHVHTHPKPSVGYHNDFPSVSPGLKGGDRIAMELFGFPEMYIIPYSRCSGTPEIIVYSDKNTWCPHYSG